MDARDGDSSRNESLTSSRGRRVLERTMPMNDLDGRHVPLSAVQNNSRLRPEIRRDYPLNLSILISGGKETNKDSLSNGE